MGAKWQRQGLGKGPDDNSPWAADKELMIERVEVEISTNNLNALQAMQIYRF